MSEKSALEICGEQMQLAASANASSSSSVDMDGYVRNEQGILRSHVLHYITQIVCMQIPLDVNARIEAERVDEQQQHSKKHHPSLVSRRNSNANTKHAMDSNGHSSSQMEADDENGDHKADDDDSDDDDDDNENDNENGAEAEASSQRRQRLRSRSVLVL